MRRHKSKHPFFGAAAGVSAILIPFLAFLVWQGYFDMNLSWLSKAPATAQLNKGPAVEERIRNLVARLPEVQGYAMWQHVRSKGQTLVVAKLEGMPRDYDGFWRIKVGEDRRTFLKTWYVFFVDAETGDVNVHNPRTGEDYTLENWRQIPVQQQYHEYYRRSFRSQ